MIPIMGQHRLISATSLHDQIWFSHTSLSEDETATHEFQLQRQSLSFLNRGGVLRFRRYRGVTILTGSSDQQSSEDRRFHNYRMGLEGVTCH